MTRTALLMPGILLLSVFFGTARSDTIVQFTLDLGTLGSNSTYQVQLFDRQAPNTVANFLRYVNNHDYDDSFLHRLVPDFIVQGGGFKLVDGPSGTQIDYVTNYGTFGNNEFDLSRSNVRGTIAMAKVGADPNSATNQWFVNIGNNSSNLDDQNGGFTVFGRVIGSGMSVIDTVNGLPITNQYQAPFDELPLVPLASGGYDLVIVKSVTALSTPSVFDWKGGAGGDTISWDSPANWGVGPAVPDAPGAQVTFGGAGAANNVKLTMFDRMVGSITFNANTSTTIQSGLYLTGSTPATGHTALSRLILDNSGGTATISVAGSHTISAPLAMGSNVAVSTSSGATLAISGDISQTAAGKGLLKSGPGTLILSGNNSYSGLTTITNGTLQLGASARSAVLTGGGSDVQGGKMLLDYSGAAPDVRTPLAYSYHAGAWDRGQFKSTTADASHGLGWADNGASQIKVACTFYGDATLDGYVDSNDLAKVLANYNQTINMVWSQGDFNYDAAVDSNDLAKVLANYNQGPIVPGIDALSYGGLDARAIQLLTAAGFTVVPEPGTLALLAAGFAALAGRMIRRRT